MSKPQNKPKTGGSAGSGKRPGASRTAGIEDLWDRPSARHNEATKLTVVDNSTPAGRNDSDEQIISIGVELIDPNPHQPRTRINEEKLNLLAATIAEAGISQPVLVRQTGDGRYELIAGERRWRAAQIAGLEKIQAIVRDVDSETSADLALTENAAREDLDDISFARALQARIQARNLTQTQASKRFGRSVNEIKKLMMLLRLPAAVQELISTEQLTAGHGIALRGEEPGRATKLANLAAEQTWSVQQLADTVQGRVEPTAATSQTTIRRHEPIAPKQRRVIEDLANRVFPAAQIKVGQRAGGYYLEVNYQDLNALENAIQAAANDQQNT